MLKRILILTFISLLSITAFTTTSQSKPKFITIHYNDLTKDAKLQVTCLADNIYHEAGIEPEVGKYAVAHVTMNRLKDERFPDTICGVVKERKRVSSIGNRTVVCQFSWYCLPVRHARDSETYKEAMRIALFVYANYEHLKDVTHGALFYHADYVQPNWKNLVKVTTIGRHIFYIENQKGTYL